MSNKVNEILTKAIIDAASNGEAKWRKPWTVLGPKSIHGRAYNGFNRLILSLQPYTDARYLTFNQMLKIACIDQAAYNAMPKADRPFAVKEGEHGIPVVLWHFPDAKQKAKNATEGKRDRVYNTYYTVFNVEQTNLVEKGLVCPYVENPRNSGTPIDAAEAIVKGMVCPPNIVHGSDRALYSPTFDVINMPNPTAFNSMEAYYATLFHEVAHWSGAGSRMNRSGIVQFDKFGSEQYSVEELVAEFCSAFLCSAAGLPCDIDQSAAYIGGWSKVFKKDPAMILTAASQAQKAFDFIMGNAVPNFDDVEAEAAGAASGE